MDGCLWVNLVSLLLGRFRMIELNRKKDNVLSSIVPKVEVSLTPAQSTLKVQ